MRSPPCTDPQRPPFDVCERHAQKVRDALLEDATRSLPGSFGWASFEAPELA